ncbi:hypothetical protein NUU61_006738 [Penicillium alfredii]|uniref:Uncharacterized protein n=1 Tax=Penicillium alfredii TaxID=1506179 RepID=A0A9W9F1D2_9EURO|nr:uncharacterized protein NUU61_006738 [Penicillium alfredii]KAJ5091868.1 hypothetical protein NUU61_006738 [Penicillium alfredii]
MTNGVKAAQIGIIGKIDNLHRLTLAANGVRGKSSTLIPRLSPNLADGGADLHVLYWVQRTAKGKLGSGSRVAAWILVGVTIQCILALQIAWGCNAGPMDAA